MLCLQGGADVQSGCAELTSFVAYMALWSLVLSEALTLLPPSLHPSTQQGAHELIPQIPDSQLSSFAAQEILPALELPYLKDQGWGLLWVEQCPGKSRMIQFFPPCRE